MPGKRRKQDAIETAHKYLNKKHPNAEAAFLCGSWAKGTAHENSDIDIIVIDPRLDDVFFEGCEFGGWIIEICSFPESLAQQFFSKSSKSRSAPVPAQLLHGVQIMGEQTIGKTIKQYAADAISKGPTPYTSEELAELRWELTMLLTDLKNDPGQNIISLAALCHSKFSLAILNISGNWRADRKMLSKSLNSHDPVIKISLDQALIEACNGNKQPLVEIGEDVLERLGGPLRTYESFSIEFDK